jgi:hypothetical protein
VTGRLQPWVLAGALAWSALPAFAQAPAPAATVSLLDGTAQVRRGRGIPRDLRQGSAVQQGDVVETGDDSRLELKLPDASALRMGPRTRLALADERPQRGPARPQQSARLLLGKVWARVSAAAGADQSFHIETENAVTVARGATLRVDAHEDRSVLVRVYSGTVAVRGKEAREKSLGRQTQILISADGTTGVPAPFIEADEKDDDWSAWNRKRDEQGK